MVKKAFNIQNIILLLLFQLLFIPLSHADQVVVTSGRVEYDPFGRAVRVYTRRLTASVLTASAVQSTTSPRHGQSTMSSTAH